LFFYKKGPTPIGPPHLLCSSLHLDLAMAQRIDLAGHKLLLFHFLPAPHFLTC
jgi:hypothetical protein